MVNKTKVGLSEWDNKKLQTSIRRSVRKKTKTKIGNREVSKIWQTFINEEIIPSLVINSVYNFGGGVKLWVKATPIMQHKRAVALMKKGLMYRQGRIMEAKLNYDTGKYIYKIYLETKGREGKKIFFNAHSSLKKAVTESVNKNKLITRFDVN